MGTFFQNFSNIYTRLKYEIFYMLLIGFWLYSSVTSVPLENPKSVPKLILSKNISHSAYIKFLNSTRSDLPGVFNASMLVEGPPSFVNDSQRVVTPEESNDLPDDRRTQEEWGEDCTVAYWDRCKVIKSWFGWYLNKHDFPDNPKWMHYELDCALGPILCMRNRWTVNRCHVLCMGQCNKEMLYKYENYISHEGECKAHAHG